MGRAEAGGNCNTITVLFASRQLVSAAEVASSVTIVTLSTESQARPSSCQPWLTKPPSPPSARPAHRRVCNWRQISRSGGNRITARLNEYNCIHRAPSPRAIARRVGFRLNLVNHEVELSDSDSCRPQLSSDDTPKQVVGPGHNLAAKEKNPPFHQCGNVIVHEHKRNAIANLERVA